MELYDQSYDESNPIRTILYLSKVDFLLLIHYMTYLTFTINLYDQPFKSTYIINFLSQPILN